MRLRCSRLSVISVHWRVVSVKVLKRSSCDWDTSQWESSGTGDLQKFRVHVFRLSWFFPSYKLISFVAFLSSAPINPIEKFIGRMNRIHYSICGVWVWRIHWCVSWNILYQGWTGIELWRLASFPGPHPAFHLQYCEVMESWAGHLGMELLEALCECLIPHMLGENQESLTMLNNKQEVGNDLVYVASLKNSSKLKI